MIRICFLADGQNSHTRKWVTFFAQHGYDVHLITFRAENIPGVHVHSVPRAYPVRIDPAAPTYAKIGYLFYLSRIKSQVKKIAPDILHAHWATSYGLIGAYSNHHPFVLSTWGSDVLDFPKKSVLHSRVLEYIINSADAITATSSMLTIETKKFIKKNKMIYSIPFGVDVKLFKPAPARKTNSQGTLTIGVTKRLERKYGIEYLILAFSKLTEDCQNLRLWIIGDGSERARLKSLCRTLGITKFVHFWGHIHSRDIPGYMKQIDIFAVPSVLSSETFGVAAVEAAACEIPVVASDIGGLPEVVIDGKTGFLVPPKNPDVLARKIYLLVKDGKLRREMGKAAREFILSKYVWEENALQMERVYQRVLEERVHL